MNYVNFKKNNVTLFIGRSIIFTLSEFSLSPIVDIMNHNIIGFWNSKKEKLKQQFQIITEEDLQFREGKEKEMMEMLCNKLGKSKEELRNIITEL